MTRFYLKIQRNILADKPRVTRFNINWGDGDEREEMPAASAEANEDSVADGQPMDTDWVLDSQNSHNNSLPAAAQG